MADPKKLDLVKVGAGVGKVKAYSRLEAVREFLLEEAKGIAKEYRALAQAAVAANRPDIAEVILWKLMTHMPREEGVTVVDRDASKPDPVVQSTSSTPSIQIGVVLGGMKPAQLEGQTPPMIGEVINVAPRQSEDEEPATTPQAVLEGPKVQS